MKPAVLLAHFELVEDMSKLFNPRKKKSVSIQTVAAILNDIYNSEGFEDMSGLAILNEVYNGVKDAP